MKLREPLFAVACGISVCFAPGKPAAESASASNHFASVYIDGDKVGQIHLTEKRNDNNEIEALTSHASMSVLGIEVYHFSQSVHEKWSDGHLKSMHAETNDDGTKYDARLRRTASGYEATLNGKPVQVPLGAFPSAFWHYAITAATEIFDMKDLSVWPVKVSKTAATLKLGSRQIDTKKFYFTGGWKASLWFDANKRLVQFVNRVQGHEVKVVLDD